MQILRYAREFLKVLQNNGPRAALSQIRDFLARRYELWTSARFDRLYSVDTAGIDVLSDFTIVSNTAQHATWYEPISTRVARRILADIQPLAKDSVFVDYGSGKGRMLLLASSLKFKKIIGVEFATELSAIANRNIARFNSRYKRCSDIESLLCDATAFPLPNDPCTIFLFAPFRGEVLEKVIANIRDSFSENPRPMCVVYAKAFHGDRFESLPFLQRRDIAASFLPSIFPNPYGYEIYQTCSSLLGRETSLVALEASPHALARSDPATAICSPCPRL